MTTKKMLNFSIAWWELALLIIAIAFIVLVYYVVRFLKSCMQTLHNVNSLVNDNKRTVENIIDNVDDITKDTSKITDKADNIAGEVTETVAAVRTDVVNPLIQAATTVVKLITTQTKRKSHNLNQD